VSVDDFNSKNVDDFTSVSADNFGSVSVDDFNSKNVDDSNNMIWWLLVGGISLLSVLIGVLLFFRHKKTKNE
jgi:LPXTG-motif cell wall-anchored protein